MKPTQKIFKYSLTVTRILVVSIFTMVLPACYENNNASGVYKPGSRLPADKASAALSWTPPSTMEDGDPASDLAGYKIYYGSEPGVYTASIDVPNTGATSLVVENLEPGTYYFTMTAYDSFGIESDYSNAVAKLAE